MKILVVCKFLMAIEILATCKNFTCDCKFALLHATKMSHQNFSHFYMWLKFEKSNLNSFVQTNLVNILTTLWWSRDSK
jgi:hypothetical protein